MSPLETWIDGALRRRRTVLFALAAVAAWGAFSWLRLPMDAFPDVTGAQVEVVCEADGWSALEIERFVTAPLENAMRGLPALRQMRSVTKYGIAVLTLVFEDRADLTAARQRVFQRMQEAAGGLPERVAVSMGPPVTAMGEIYQYVLTGGEDVAPGDSARALARLRTLQDRVVAPALKGVPGVSDINSFGGYVEQVEVTVDPSALVRYGLTLGDVTRSLGRASLNVGGGVLPDPTGQVVIRGLGLAASLGDLERAVLKTWHSVPVLLSDVAEVRMGRAVRQGAALMNGDREVVGGIVMLLRGENGRETVRRVRERVDEINGSGLLPAGVRIEPFYDRRDIVEASTATVLRALAEGSGLVLVVLYVFLRSLRGAGIVLLGLPLSLLAAFGVMRITGLDANLMSLGGLAISMGMIIDATIIQVENVQRRLGRLKPAEPKLPAVLRAVMEVRKPSLAGELIIALTFLPILALEGLEGRMFAPLALTVAVALLCSLVLSVFAVPVLCLVLLKASEERESPVLGPLRRGYRPLLEWAFRRRAAVLALAGAALAAALLLLPRLGTEFIPIMDEGAFDMDVQLLPGASLEHALETSRKIETRLKRFPELVTIVGRTGQTGIALEARGVDKTGYVGILKPRGEWETAGSREALTDRMREALADIPGMAFGFSQPIQCRVDELVAGTRAQLIVKLFGTDLDSLVSLSRAVASAIGGLRGATDLVVEKTAGQPTLVVEVDRERLSRHGLNAADVLEIVETAVGGRAAAKFYERDRAVDAVVRYPEAERRSGREIGSLLIPCPGGYALPLGQLAEIRTEEGPVQVSREDGQRRIGIEINVSGRDLGGFVAEAKRTVAGKVRLPEGVRLAWGGQFENQERAMRRFAFLVPAVIAMIFALLSATFSAWRPALLVLLNLPFALIGGVFALALSGLYLSVPASVGFIVLFGVAVLNGMVLMSRVLQLSEQGMSVPAAVRRACDDRLRPVLMTATISVFSLLPMLAASGPGSEIQRPLATVVVGGLLTSTLLTLVLLPVMTAWVMEDRRKA